MRAARFVLVVAAMCLTLSAVYAAQQARDNRAELALQAAIKIETIDGDLKAAIEAFKKVVATYESNRAVAAQALVHIGQCYEKLGAANAQDARKTYERILQQYPEQKDLVAQARTRLVALGGPMAAAAGGPVVRRLIPADLLPIEEGTVSTDGRSFVYIDWNEGNLVAYKFATGAKHDVTALSGAEPCGWAMAPAVSFDNAWVAYPCQTKEEKFAEASWELRVAPFGGGRAPRTVYRSTDASLAAFVSWFGGDSRLLVVARKKDGSAVLLEVVLADGRAREIESDRGIDATSDHFALSPDNRWLLFDRPQAAAAYERNVFAVSMESGAVVPIVVHAAHDYVLGWSPDGSQVIFASDRAGRIGIWSQRVAKGQAVGAPVSVLTDAGGIIPNRLTPSGSLFYTQSSETPDVYLTDIDLGAGTVKQTPSAVDARTVSGHTAPAWSRDGSLFSWVRVALPGPTSPATLVVRAGKGNSRQVNIGLRQVAGVRWSPDGRSLLMMGSRDGDGVGWYRVDAESGASVPMFPDFQQVAVLDWMPDGQSIFLARSGSFSVRDLRTGSERVVFSPGQAGTVRGPGALSPDGSRMAFLSRDSETPKAPWVLVAVALSGGRPQMVYRPVEGSTISALAWTPDGRQFVVGVRSESDSGAQSPASEGPGARLWLVPLDGGAPRDLGVNVKRLHSDLRVRPDGRQIAFTAGYFQEELWVMDNIIPKATK